MICGGVGLAMADRWEKEAEYTEVGVLANGFTTIALCLLPFDL